ncbi:MAG: PocR ligand-binding domain-containing protein [bacterium]|nr:PocR ligand-binding domain-containing protein [bacterium]
MSAGKDRYSRQEQLCKSEERFHTLDITDLKLAEQRLAESEAVVGKKLDAILSPDGGTGSLDLADIIDSQALQSLMDDYYRITGIGIAVIDLSGRVLVACGWQDICIKFHRVHRETLANCLESDTVLSSGLTCGDFKLYRCKNNLWDAAIPIVVGGKHMGNLFFGQFFFEDETLDYALFRSMARQYGFDETEYLAALDRVPRWSREKIDTVAAFYGKLSAMISSMSHNNIKLARALSERDALLLEVRQSEERYRSYIDNAPHGVFIADENGRYIQTNPAACRLTGYDASELLKMSIPDLLSPDAVDDGLQHFQRVKTDGSAAVELPIVARDKERRWIEVRATRLSETRFLGFAEDITERKQADEVRAELQAKLAQTQKMETVGRLAGGVAHEFNNIMAGVSGYAQLTLRKLPQDSGMATNMTQILTLVDRGATLVRQLMSFSRVHKVDAVLININGVIGELLRILEQALGNGISIAFTPDASLWPVRMEQGQIEQIVLNMAMNSRDAISETDQGQFSIRTSNVIIGQEPVESGSTGIESGEYVRLEISDNGSGMDEAAKKHVFEPFFTTKEVGKGTGLGMSMVYGIVKEYNGHISVESRQGEGTVFEILLPRA